MSLLENKELSKNFGGVIALNNVAKIVYATLTP